MIATYRLQVQPDFGFAEIEKLLPYFVRLGISHLYLSPISQARPGSTHGYDVIDHNAVREELGGREGFDRLADRAAEHGLKLILDFVPNHAGVGPKNNYWQDVLAYGPHSAFAPYFDIDWNPIKPELQGRILLPFLGKPYGDALDDDELSLAYEDGYLYATYYENRYRLNPSSYRPVLEAVLRAAERTEPYWDLRDLVTAYETLDPHERDKAEALRKRLIALFKRVDPDPILSTFASELVHEILEKQFWRLSFWKTAGSEINYRRFFDINELVALRMEDDHVFWDAHQLLAELLAHKAVEGVRIDHVDGLFDPHDYLDRLKNVGDGKIWVEKILAAGETLPDDWPVSGTTGYEFMNDAMGVLLQRDGRLALERIYRRHVDTFQSFDDIAYESKKFVIESSLSSELNRLSVELDRISEADYHTRDFTLEAIRTALTELVSVFERYRTYLPHEEDVARSVIQHALHRALARNPVAEPTVYTFIANVILGNTRDRHRSVRRAWVGRLQQYTAPVAAKGVEDTAFYRHLTLSALNEVGGEPADFGTTVHAFHSHARFRAHRYPDSIIATATHDHKRGEDTRMRLIGIAEMPDLWETTVRALGTIGERHVTDGAPSRADRYLFFQTLAVLWTDAARRESIEDRLKAYMLKASRESKLQTSWTHPDSQYEDALNAFVAGVLADDETPDALVELSQRLANVGFTNTISQLVLKMTTPGVPDIYQGCELFDVSLVDPDNRRPVDYGRRTTMLDELSDLLERPDSDRVAALLASESEVAKMYVTASLLRFRRNHADLLRGEYQAVESDEGARFVAYSLSRDDEVLFVVVPRYPASGDDSIPTIPIPDDLVGRQWKEALTGARLEFGTELNPAEWPIPWAILVTTA